MKRLPNPAIPLQGEPIECRGGPLDGFVTRLVSPRPHIFWKNKSGTFDVYVLTADRALGWVYRHEPDAVVGAEAEDDGA